MLSILIYFMESTWISQLWNIQEFFVLLADEYICSGPGLHLHIDREIKKATKKQQPKDSQAWLMIEEKYLEEFFIFVILY